VRRQLSRALVAGVAALSLAAQAPAQGSRSPVAVVVVPPATGRYDLITAYHRLHAAGLRTEVARTFTLASLCLPSARTQSPPAGARVSRGVTVTLRGLTCAAASPAASATRAVVPDFTGQRATRAVAWAGRTGLYWKVDRIPPLHPSGLAALLDNYVVTDQSPAAGQLLGRGTDCSTYATRCFRVTPLVVHVRRARG
jgi:hypothetical protein